MFLQSEFPAPTGTMGVLSMIFTALLPLVATWLFQWVKAGITALDKAPDVVKQVAYIVFAALLAWLSTVLGQALPGDIHELTPDVLATVILAIANTFVFKAGSNQSETPSGGTT